MLLSCVWCDGKWERQLPSSQKWFFILCDRFRWAEERNSLFSTGEWRFCALRKSLFSVLPWLSLSLTISLSIPLWFLFCCLYVSPLILCSILNFFLVVLVLSWLSLLPVDLSLIYPRCLCISPLDSCSIEILSRCPCSIATLSPSIDLSLISPPSSSCLTSRSMLYFELILLRLSPLCGFLSYSSVSQCVISHMDFPFLKKKKLIQE